MTEKRRWTEADDATLRQMWADRNTAKDIAKKLRRTPASVRARIHVERLMRYNKALWTAEEDTLLTKMYSEHIPLAGIAAALNGRSMASVRQRIFGLHLIRDKRKTRLAIRYGQEILANGKDPVAIMMEIREREQGQRAQEQAAHNAKVNALLDEMEKGVRAGCDRGFMFMTAYVGGATLQQIGDRVSLTRERVRQVIEARAAGVVQNAGSEPGAGSA